MEEQTQNFEEQCRKLQAQQVQLVGRLDEHIKDRVGAQEAKTASLELQVRELQAQQQRTQRAATELANAESLAQAAEQLVSQRHSALRALRDLSQQQVASVSDAGTEQTLIEFEIGTGHDYLGHFWSIPEYDDNLRVIGIQRRYTHGEKLAIAGSSRGLVIPSGEWNSSAPIAVVEGFSDSAALHACGVQVVGRPSAFGGSVLLGGFLQNHPGPVIVVGENDQKVDGRWPGRDGAMSIASYLQQLGHNEVSVILPPADCKDARSVFLRYESETTRVWLQGAVG